MTIMENVTNSGLTPDARQKIVRGVRAFDLAALLRLLRHYGFQPYEIIFKSHMSDCSQRTLIEGIEFQQAPRRVTITLNMGLLSAQTTLPSYFQKTVARKDIDAQNFADFIGFFDHFLIVNYVYSLYPEKNSRYFSNWEQTKRDYLELMDLKSCSTLFWIFQLVFPELTITVQKIIADRELTAAPLVIGKTVLGSDSVFGRKTTVPVYGRRVTLFSDQEATAAGMPWPKEIRRRLEQRVFPVLRPVELDLEIIHVIKTQKRWMKLHSESYLGYDKIKGGEAQFRRIRIYHGRLREAQKRRAAGNDNHGS